MASLMSPSANSDAVCCSKPQYMKERQETKAEREEDRARDRDRDREKKRRLRFIGCCKSCILSAFHAKPAQSRPTMNLWIYYMEPRAVYTHTHSRIHAYTHLHTYTHKHTHTHTQFISLKYFYRYVCTLLHTMHIP